MSTTTATTTELERLAVLAEHTADQLHETLKSLRELHDRTLSLIEEIGGDREFNWALQADIAHAQNALYATAHKARQIARHARTPRKDIP